MDWVVFFAVYGSGIALSLGVIITMSFIRGLLGQGYHRITSDFMGIVTMIWVLSFIMVFA